MVTNRALLVALLRSHALALAAFGDVRVERVGGEGRVGGDDGAGSRDARRRSLRHDTGGAAGVAPRLRDGPAVTNGEDALPLLEQPTKVRLQLVRGAAGEERGGHPHRRVRKARWRGRGGR